MSLSVRRVPPPCPTGGYFPWNCGSRSLPAPAGVFFSMVVRSRGPAAGRWVLLAACERMLARPCLSWLQGRLKTQTRAKAGNVAGTGGGVPSKGTGPRV